MSLIITWNLTESEFPNDMDVRLQNRIQNRILHQILIYFKKKYQRQTFFWHIWQFPQHILHATENFKFSESYRALGLRNSERSLMLKQKRAQPL